MNEFVESIYIRTKSSMGKCILALENDLKRIRTGRASLSLLDGIKIDYYGTLTQLSQMSTLSIPESRLIIVQPWDISSIKEIEKAIMKSDLGLTPSNDGKVIRIPIPSLTEDRRKELVKIVHKICEDYKVSERNIRRDSNEFLKTSKKEKSITEDVLFKAQEKIQAITNEYITKIDEIETNKIKEIIEF